MRRPATTSLDQIWRVQRDQIYPDVITCLTKDRKQSVMVSERGQAELFGVLADRLGQRSTMYCKGFLSGGRLVLQREAPGW